ncbi:MAG: UDP-N-acetylglucosamine 2-epimerase (non-hydrolyzing) [Bacteroidia bacterium]|nr:UDP-N-acetylglucosamine 2-epimerase (non-hydrolyzing) [Bacteroidia bacterium]
MKILTVVGARPQIIKAAAISRAISRKFPEFLEEAILHTGQHYDQNMSNIFFEELEIPLPLFNLYVGSESHGKQLAEMITGIEKALLDYTPDMVLLYGDTNSTLAGAMAAAKINIPIAQIEAGLRSFNKSMPEEINRIMTDHVSTLLFSPTVKGIENLVKEGFKKDAAAPFNTDNPKVYHCGDVMYDNSLYFSDRAEKETDILEKHGLKKEKFILATVHRNNNTDDKERLNAIFSALNDISTKKDCQIFLPLHPRTSKLLAQNLKPELFKLISENKKFIIAPPASYLEMIALEKNCSLVMTDSGGLQKEAYYFNKPCIIMRPETEWVELVECGCALIADADHDKITKAFAFFENQKELKFPQLYGDGKAAEFICNEIKKFFSER